MEWKGTNDDKRALRDALAWLKAEQGITPYQVALRMNADGKVIDQSTISRWLSSRRDPPPIDYESGGRVFAFLLSDPALWSPHINGPGLAAEIDPLSLGFMQFLAALGIAATPENQRAATAFCGRYRMVRPWWLARGRADLALASTLEIEDRRGLLAARETQSYRDPSSGIFVNEHDEGVLFQYGANMFILMREEDERSLKFMVAHYVYPAPSEGTLVTAFAGHLIAASGKGPHPGYPFYCERIEQAAEKPRMGAVPIKDLPDYVLEYVAPEKAKG